MDELKEVQRSRITLSGYTFDRVRDIILNDDRVVDSSSFIMGEKWFTEVGDDSFYVLFEPNGETGSLSFEFRNDFINHACVCVVHCDRNSDGYGKGEWGYILRLLNDMGIEIEYSFDIKLSDVDFDDWRSVIRYADEDGGVFYTSIDDDGDEMIYCIEGYCYLSDDSMIAVILGETSRYRKKTKINALIHRNEPIRMVDDRCGVHDVSEVLENCLVEFVREWREYGY
jgi:hypothetical protein